MTNPAPTPATAITKVAPPVAKADAAIQTPAINNGINGARLFNALEHACTA